MFTLNEEEGPEWERSDLINGPSNAAVHAIGNASEEVLTCVSAATSALDAEVAYDTGQETWDKGGDFRDER